jgi:adenylosuccinate synthase
MTSDDAHRAILVVDLAFGDCGKGTIVDFLTRAQHAHTIVRFNGGPQAGHNVVTPDGRHHTFAQFGSGSFVPKVRTFLSRFMLLEPYALFNEARHLHDLGISDAFDRLVIDARCPIITPCHQAANQLRELAHGPASHGTCGLGIGETMQDLSNQPSLMIRAGELGHRDLILQKLNALQALKADQLRETIAALRNRDRARRAAETLLDSRWIDVAADNYVELASRATILDATTASALLCSPGTLIFEGAQGVLLDEWFGFHPHTTWSTTTFANADTLLNEAGHDGDRTRVGVLRSYFTRHGPGPLVCEEPALKQRLPEPHNNDAGWQGAFRVGAFDAVAARYAIDVAGGVDVLAMTHLDRLASLPSHICSAYQKGNGETLSDLRVRRPADLGYQESMTRALQQCKPVHVPVAIDNANTFLNTIERELRIKIAIASFGPIANDKRLLRDRL